MKHYLAYKNQIRGLADVHETVKTVEKIAASSVHYLDQEVDHLMRYEQIVDRILKRLSHFHNEYHNPLFKNNSRGKKAALLITGDRGLTGGLWRGVFDLYETVKDQYGAVIIIGAKAKGYMREIGYHVTKEFPGISDENMDETFRDVATYCYAAFRENDFSSIDVIYPHYESLGVQHSLLTPFLPFVFTGEEGDTKDGFPLIEPSRTIVFNRLLQKYISIYFKKIITDAILSEHAARTVAMEDASTKTKSLIAEISLHYQKERHRASTQQQLESFMAHRNI
ncbi:MAG: F0F1 ATP synthase subunit gamma [Patescibacteria group bacterium]|nr:F0F1 ATP synthase subunit gamma [Patescibacteria group bacterium]MDE2438260.1 F0F1 ATP synthase subunit gamma [Patescibacteria group bacterium]